MCTRLVLVAVCLLAGTRRSAGVCTDYCYPGMSCYPTTDELIQLGKSLSGGAAEGLVNHLQPKYYNITLMKDTLHTRFPYIIVVGKTVEDVQKAILFARKFNLRVSIYSSGHDYLGRSTADGSIMIDLAEMKGIDIDLNSPLNSDGVIRCETGNSWARVYEKLDKLDRVVVGGSAHSVAMGGYTLGGGHSPLSRSLGLAVDNLLEVTMVTADGAIVNVSASGSVSVSADGTVIRSSDPDLFWALRGGGGGTFGVVTSFLYRLHKPPASFGHINCQFSYSLTEKDEAKDFIKFYFDLTKTLPNEWGGYFVGSFDFNIQSYDHVAYTVFMLHYGPSDEPTFAKIQPLVDYHPEKQKVKCTKQEYPSFWAYEQTAVDPLYTRFILISSFARASDFTENMSEWIRDLIMSPPTNTSLGSCTNTLIGGQVRAVGDDDTAVSADFRSALGSLSCSSSWEDNPLLDMENMAAATKMEERLQKLSHGVYINEPPAKMSNWKRDFWGSHYARLLRVKKQWDPSNFLTCLYCVGSDLGRNYGQSGAAIIG